MDVLRIDVDRGERLLSLAELQGLLARAGKRLCWMQQERSRSSHGWHITLKVTPPCETLPELIALQAICGSDPYREANNLLRARQVKHVAAFWRRVSCVNVFYDPLY